MAELDEVLWPRVGVRAGVDEDGGAAEGRDRDRDRRPVHVGQAPVLEQGGCKERAGVPGRDDGVGLAVRHRSTGREHGAVPLRAGCVRGLLVHLDHGRGVDDLEVVGERPDAVRQAEEDRDEPFRARLEGAGHDLLGSAISPHRVDGDANRGHGLGTRFRMTLRRRGAMVVALQGRRERSYPEDMGAPEDAVSAASSAARRLKASF